jgi:hypothetical protein
VRAVETLTLFGLMARGDATSALDVNLAVRPAVLRFYTARRRSGADFGLNGCFVTAICGTWRVIMAYNTECTPFSGSNCHI